MSVSGAKHPPKSPRSEGAPLAGPEQRVGTRKFVRACVMVQRGAKGVMRGGDEAPDGVGVLLSGRGLETGGGVDPDQSGRGEPRIRPSSRTSAVKPPARVRGPWRGPGGRVRGRRAAAASRAPRVIEDGRVGHAGGAEISTRTSASRRRARATRRGLPVAGPRSRRLNAAEPRALRTRSTSARSIDRHEHAARVVPCSGAARCRSRRPRVPGRARVRDEAGEVGAGVDRRRDVHRPREAADQRGEGSLEVRMAAHRSASPGSRPSRHAVSSAPGSDARISVSPTSTASAPAAAIRAASAAQRIPLSATRT